MVLAKFNYYLSQYVYLFFALIFGAVGTLSFSPYDIWPFALISLFALQLLLLRKSLVQAIAIGFFWGFGLFISGIHWIYISIADFGGMPKIINLCIMILLIVYLSLYPMIFSVLLNIFWPNISIGRLIFAAPAVWQITEFLRGWLFTGFPWLQFGYTQINGPLKNLAPLAGVEIITFLLMIIAGLLVHCVYFNNFKSLVLAIILLSPYPLNMFQWYHLLEKKYITVTIVQGNIPQYIKWNPQQLYKTLHIYTSYSQPWIGKVNIIVWPEAALTDLESNQQFFLCNLDKLLRKYNSSLITGIVDSRLGKNNQQHDYNSLIVLGDKIPYNYQGINRYQKNHLVPFGEFVPLEKLLRPLSPFFNLPMSSFSRGAYVQPQLKVGNYKLISAICYEIIFGEQIRANYHSDTNFILTVSNDAWFGHSIGLWQHFQMARMRALELGRPLLSSTNNGITAIVNADGNIEKILKPFTRQVLNTKVTITTGETPYTKLGIWPVWILTLMSLILSRSNSLHKE
ncbi:apolipoprotein N-acyltransferase [Pantoea sp. Mhis]|uniref:apolipoprotein N-acyltransferase n=1 Tax=Pantoea sp. Mhis TaxID=2576759 RepID=UPI00135A8428|nr:apolipoprotein N-acyltransferase [Pantoea sp. Mhis]MXP56273.1 apolipoprotein N-acyltransferase [Pantoea sp. Mhis]